MKRLDYYWYSINFVSLLLLPLSGLFCSVSFIRSKLYDFGILKSYRAPLPVVVIGNITVGGTGKTPLIIELVKQLQAGGRKPGVISRGYGGNATSWPQIVNTDTNAAKVGDEPQFIYQRTRCPLVVGPDRKQDIELLIKQFDCDIVLSDDGLQHYALQRDIEVVVVDASRQFGNGFCIPSGPLRETVSRLQKVDMVLLNGGGELQNSFSIQTSQCSFVGQGSIEKVNISDFSGKIVHAVAGIGNPQRFFSMLENLGIEVIPHAYADHYNYKESDFIFMDNLPVLMTEKDAIKCNEFKLNNHWSVPIDIVLSESAQQRINEIFEGI